MFFLFHRNLWSLFTILLSWFLSLVWICFAREIGGKAGHDWENFDLESHTKANAVLSTWAPDVGLMEGERFNTRLMTVLGCAAGGIWCRMCALWVEVGPDEVCACGLWANSHQDWVDSGSWWLWLQVYSVTVWGKEKNHVDFEKIYLFKV